ncbi:MAG: hypothetical protein JJU46_05485 [Balneolaceae bacterium]|nr:hypothetical protein [Balneolaceae bacterium]MCH8548635.1 hypothetical protein [Balneolaceae bacterium]
MTSKKEIYEYRVPFQIRSYEVNSRQEASIASICDYFQEAAGVHAHHLDFDISHLQERGLTWVLYKMHVRAERFPKRWDDVEVITRPSSGDGIRAFRDYELLDSNGSRLAAGISQWMVLDIKTRRPVRMPKEVLEMGIEQKEHIIEPDKSPVDAAEGESADLQEITTAGLHDLDMNRHVNNVAYIRWVTGFMPPKLVKGRFCSEVEIQYRSEAVSGDRIGHAFVQENSEREDEIRIRHTLSKGGGRKQIATAVSCWRLFSSS